MSQILFQNCTLLDTVQGRMLPEHHVLIEDDGIKEVSDRPITSSGAHAVDVRVVGP